MSITQNKRSLEILMEIKLSNSESGRSEEARVPSLRLLKKYIYILASDRDFVLSFSSEALTPHSPGNT